MITRSLDRNSTPDSGELNKQPRWRTSKTYVFVLSMLLGVGILAGLATLTQNASARQASGKQAEDAPSAPGAVNSPHCDPNWVAVNSPNVTVNDNVLFAVTVISSSDVWAVGIYNNGTAQQTLTEHWNGATWNVVYSPNPSTGGNLLHDVSAISSGDVWAVGYAENSAGQNQTLTEHWDGTAWSVISSPNASANDNEIVGAEAISAGDVWAVGFYKSSTVYKTLTEHWNGTAWSIVASQNANTSDNQLAKVSAISSGDVWAVGIYQDGTASKTLTEHWNGSAWSVVDSPNPSTSQNALVAVTAISTGDVWAVGFFQNGNPLQTLTEHWDGTAWNIVYSPNPSASENYFFGIAAVSSTNLRTVGYTYSSGLSHTLIEHGDGTLWNTISSPDIGTAANGLYGVAAVSGGDVWAVGDYQNTGSHERTLIVHYNPCSATATPTTTSTSLPTQTPGGPTATPTSTATATATAVACSIQFTDVVAGSTFYDNIRCLACRGIINGYPCGTAGEPCDGNNDPYFRPNANVTRGQIAKIVALSADIQTPVTGQTFEDVPSGSTFYTYIGQLYALGAMNGYACGGAGEPCNPPANLPYFRPNANATRGQLAKIDSTAVGYIDPPSGQTFEDVPPGSTFYDYIQRLTSRSVMSGYACGGTGEPCNPPANLPYFRPSANVTRGQTSKIVGNTFYPDCQTP